MLAVAAGAGALFGRIFAVPAALEREAMGGLLLTGASTAVYIIFSIFNCQLWARERLDVIAAIEIPVQIGKLLAILLLIDHDAPLTLLAAITIPANLLSGLAAMAACRRLGLAPGVKLSLASRAELRGDMATRPAALRLPVRADGKPADRRDDRRQPAGPGRRHLLFAGARAGDLHRHLRRNRGTGGRGAGGQAALGRRGGPAAGPLQARRPLCGRARRLLPRRLRRARRPFPAALARRAS